MTLVVLSMKFDRARPHCSMICVTYCTSQYVSTCIRVLNCISEARKMTSM